MRRIDLLLVATLAASAAACLPPEWVAVADASPEEAARRIKVPVLLIHGAADEETPPAHSRRIEAALAGPKRLLLVEGAGHGGALARPEPWRDIESWLAALPG